MPFGIETLLLVYYYTLFKLRLKKTSSIDTYVSDPLLKTVDQVDKWWIHLACGRPRLITSLHAFTDSKSFTRKFLIDFYRLIAVFKTKWLPRYLKLEINSWTHSFCLHLTFRFMYVIWQFLWLRRFLYPQAHMGTGPHQVLTDTLNQLVREGQTDHIVLFPPSFESRRSAWSMIVCWQQQLTPGRFRRVGGPGGRAGGIMLMWRPAGSGG